MLHGRMPLSTFRNLVNNIYDIVRESFVPLSLRNGRDNEFIDFPILQPAFSSLLIAIDHPTIDVPLMKRRYPNANLDPRDLQAESEAEGAKFIERFEKTVDIASTDKLSPAYAQENFGLLENIVSIMPAPDTNVSRLQLSSSLKGQQRFVDIDAKVGERIRVAYRGARDTPVSIAGKIIGMVRKSHTFILEDPKGRELTCHIVPEIYDDMLGNGDIVVGRRLQVSGDFQKRDRRDKLRVDSRPIVLAN